MRVYSHLYLHLAARDSMREEKILVNNLRVNYKMAGSGPAILVLHGWGGSSDSWNRVQEILAKKGYQVLIPDFPGFGKSITPPESWGLEDYMEWLKSFIEEIRKTCGGFSEPFYLIGHSFGGRVAIKFVTKYPERIKRLILCDSAGIKPKLGLKTIIIFWLAKIGNAIFTPKHLQRFKDSARNLFYIFLRKRDYVKAKGTMKKTIRKVLDEDLLEDLSKIETKTLIVWGNADRMVPVKYAYIFKDKIANSEIEVLPKTGHSPHLENPEKLSEIILNFLKQ